MSAYVAEEDIVDRPEYRLTISAPEAGTVRLTARRRRSSSATEIVSSLDEIDIAADEFVAVVEAMKRWRWAVFEEVREA
jgi:hypothetical protein